MLPKIECSDQLLLGILNQDSGGSTELGLQHLDNCEHCQARIEELAANQEQWTLAREGLCSRVEGGQDIGNDFQNPTRFHSTAEHSSDWTDTMAKQLLQPPSHPEMLGRLGRYEIERLVGSGGMGVVFKAYDSELHRSVAIKMLAPHLSGSRSARERFAREARAAAAIVNDHVVPIHNVETEHATPYLVMQYIAGDSLQARLDRDGPLDVCEILRIGMQVATGLAAAHAQGLIHRDVKPSNIMLDENVARALLTDFGLARTQDEACLTRSGFHPGTPHYMSPEQVRGEELDGRSDLFSLGCVLYALCTGHPPYRADSGYAVMRRITDEQPRSIREQNALIPEWLERVVMRLLEKDRKARCQSAEELAQILEQCLAHVQKPASEPLPLAVVPKAPFFDSVRIRNWILAGMASAFLFFAGVLIVLETNKGTITIKSEADNVPIRIKRSDQVVYEMVVSRTGKSVRLGAGEYVIEFDGEWQDLVVEGENVSLVRGETKIIQITYRKSDGAEVPLSKGTQTREIYEKAIEECERLVASAPENSEYSQNLATAYDKMGDLFLSQGNGTQAYKYANKAREIRKRLASIATSAMSESTSTEKDKRVLSAISSLDAPATITVDEELGVVTLKGSREDVARTNRIIEMIRKMATKQTQSWFDETPASESTTPVKDKRVLSAITRLDAPASIAVDEEHGIVTVKGSKADVEKTTRTIEMIRRVADENPSTPIDWSKLNTEVPVVASELAAAVNEFNFNQKNWWAAANYPLLTEDEVCAALWWQANHTTITPELRKEVLAIVLDRKLPTGWSIRLSKWRGEMRDRQQYLPGNTPLQAYSLEINLMRGDQIASTIRSKFVGKNHTSRDKSTSPLADAIDKFNKERAGVEPPLTLAETLAAIATLWTKEPDRRPESSGLTEVAVAKLKTLADHLTMDGITVESSLRDHQVGDSKFLTWKIDLAVMSDAGIGWAETFPIRKRFIQVESDRISTRIKVPTSLHTYNALSPNIDFSKPKATMSTVASDLASVVNDFNRVHIESLRSSNSLPLTEDELVASLWWQYSQSKLREEIRETVKEIVITRKLPPGWFIKLNSREWDLPQQWWHEKPLSSSAIQINLIGKEGLATTIRNQFVSSDATSLQPPESPLKMAIEEFNKSHSEEPDLTLDETLAALSTLWGKQSWYSSDRLKPSTMDALMAVVDRHVMKGVKIELLRSYEVKDGDRFSVWSVRLVVQDEQDGSTQAFTIRERFQKVNSFSDETIHWGKPSDAGLQAGFRLRPAQTRYLAGQVVDVEFFYRTIHGKGLKASVPAAFHFNKIEIDLNRADDKQRLWVTDDREKIIGGWREEMIGEQPTLFKNRKIRFVDSPERLATANQITDDWTSNVMLPINTKCDITFDVSDFAEPAKKSASLLTGSAQVSILGGRDEKRPLANTAEGNQDWLVQKLADSQPSNLESELRIAGTCVDENDKPIENAVIELYENDRLKFKSLRTGADGAFDFGTVPAPDLSANGYVHYVVVGRATGKAIGAALPFGYSGKSNDLKIALGAPGQLKGKVTGPDGSPVSGARVSTAGLPWIDGVHGAITNAAGEYVLDSIPLLEHPGMSRRRGPGFPKEGIMASSAQRFMIVKHPSFGLFQPGYAECPATVDVTLDKPAIVTGRVVDEQGRPIAGIKVSARASQNPVHRFVVAQSQLRGVCHGSSDTNADGEYSIMLQYAGPIDLTFKGSKHLAKTVNDVFVANGETVDAPEVIAAEPAYVVGRIVDVDTDKTVACPTGVRLRVYSMGNGPVSSVIVQPDGTFRLPVVPGTTFVYFSIAPDSIQELTKLWDVLDHPNPLNAKQYPIEADRNKEVEVNFPVKVNKEKLGQVMQSLQGDWEIQSGTYVAGGNARLALPADRLLDGEKRPLRFRIHGNQWLGHSTNFCGAPEPELGIAFCDGVAELMIDESSSAACLMLVRFENGTKRTYPCLYQVKGDQLELVCNASSANQRMPESRDFLHEGFVLQAERISHGYSSSSLVGKKIGAGE